MFENITIMVKMADSIERGDQWESVLENPSLPDLKVHDHSHTLCVMWSYFGHSFAGKTYSLMKFITVKSA